MNLETTLYGVGCEGSTPGSSPQRGIAGGLG